MQVVYILAFSWVLVRMRKFLKLQYYCRGFQDHVHQFWHNSDEWFERYSCSKIDTFFVIKMFACELLKICAWENSETSIFETGMFQSIGTPIFMKFRETHGFSPYTLVSFINYCDLQVDDSHEFCSNSNLMTSQDFKTKNFL